MAGPRVITPVPTRSASTSSSSKPEPATSKPTDALRAGAVGRGARFGRRDGSPPDWRLIPTDPRTVTQMTSLLTLR